MAGDDGDEGGRGWRIVLMYGPLHVWLHAGGLLFCLTCFATRFEMRWYIKRRKMRMLNSL